MILAITESIKAGSQKTYLSHYCQYVIWCKQRLIAPFEFPSPYVQVAAFILDKINIGVVPGTVRGYIAAIRWINDIAGFQNSSGSGWNTQHFLLKRLKGSVKINSKGSGRSNSALTLAQTHLLWLWNLYNNSNNIKERAAVISFFFGIAFAARASSLWKGRFITKGLKLKHINIIYSSNQDYLTKKWHLIPPVTLFPQIIGLRLTLYDIKTGTVNQYYTKYIGRTNVHSCDPIIAFIKYLKMIKVFYKLSLDPDSYAFRDQFGTPLTTDYISQWMKLWTHSLPNYDKDLCSRIKPHSMRKTFCCILYRLGWDMVQIAAYGDWSVPSSLIYYCIYQQSVALSIIKQLIYGKQLPQYLPYICDLDLINLKNKKC